MRTVLDTSLYENNKRQFQKIEDDTRKFTAAYCGNTIVGENIFDVISNYARKKETPLEMLRYPFGDDELWAFTFLKKGTIFVCVNSELPLSKQIFAAAHELYHIYCYTEDLDQSTIRAGSLLDSKTADDEAQSHEDIEANAFAALLLMPTNLLYDQMSLYGISKENIRIDDVLLLIDFFGIPYKAVVLRLYESQSISKSRAVELVAIRPEKIQERIELTGRAKRWTLNGQGLESFGSLLDNLHYNCENELLTETRQKEDTELIDQLNRKIHSM